LHTLHNKGYDKAVSAQAFLRGVKESRPRPFLCQRRTSLIDLFVDLDRRIGIQCHRFSWASGNTMRTLKSRVCVLKERSISNVYVIGFGYLLSGAAAAYGLIAWLAASLPLRAMRLRSAERPPVTILKPLCGTEPETYECLKSFCDQDYPEFQIVFGVADSADPALAIVQQLQREFPRRDLQIALDRREHGSSRKISNLINMMALASAEYLVIADSDVRVARDYLSKIVVPLLDPQVGIVTCAYRGVSRQGLWSVLGSLFINDWFMPSVRVAAWAGSRSFAFGATIALRREVLAKIGGFSAISNHLADDYRLGELTRRLGLRTELSEVEVEVVVAERSFADLAQHELRWLRTIRAIRPAGYGFYFVTFGIPVALMGTFLAQARPPALAMLATVLMTRMLLFVGRRRHGFSLALISLIPLRDFLSLSLWGWSFLTRRVIWRDEHFEILRDGSALPIVRMNL
jgi:ceramide glucosyltransferase